MDVGKSGKNLITAVVLTKPPLIEALEGGFLTQKRIKFYCRRKTLPFLWYGFSDGVFDYSLRSLR